MSNIPVHGVERTASHPAWTPVSVDGTAPTDGGTATAVGDPQPFGVGSAPFITGTTPNIHTFKGDDGQMITISGYNTADTIEDHSGDGDSAAQMRSVDFEVPGTRQLSCVVPAGWEWMAKFLQTVFRDSMKRPMKITDVYATGVMVSQEFLIATLSHPIEAKGVLKIEADLTPYGAATETDLS